MSEDKGHLKNVRMFHDSDSRRYKEERYHTNSCEGLSYITRKEIILDSLGKLSGRVLDIGCGPGILTPHLIEHGFQVYSIDLSIEMLKKAREESNGRIGNHGIFAVSEATKICFARETFNAVFCIGVLYYLNGYQSLLNEISRVLNRDGTAIIQVNKTRFPWLYKIMVPVYHTLKSLLTGKRYDKMNFKFNIFSYLNFLADLKKDFYVEKVHLYDFRVPFIDILFPKASVSLGKLMFGHRNVGFFKPFAHGMLVVVRKRA